MNISIKINDGKDGKIGWDESIPHLNAGDALLPISKMMNELRELHTLRVKSAKLRRKQ